MTDCEAQRAVANGTGTGTAVRGFVDCFDRFVVVGLAVRTAARVGAK